jgi:hypothetical protein
MEQDESAREKKYIEKNQKTGLTQRMTNCSSILSARCTHTKSAVCSLLPGYYVIILQQSPGKNLNHRRRRLIFSKNPPTMCRLNQLR